MKYRLYITLDDDMYRELLDKLVIHTDDKNKNCMPNMFNNDAINLFSLSYDYMSEQLFLKDKNRKSKYPLWFWYEVEGSKDIMKNDKMFFYCHEGRFYVLECMIDEKRVLLSDFDLWHCVLNGVPAFDDEKEDKEFDEYLFNNDIKYHDIFVKNDQKILDVKHKVYESWKNIFNLSCNSKYSRYENKTIQAVTWELFLDDVVKIHKFFNTKEDVKEYNRFCE